MQHVPVMESEVIAGLQIKAEGCYVDGTFGRGGHSRAILQKLNPNGTLHVFDRDPQAIACASEHWGDDPRVRIHSLEFSQMGSVIALESVDGVLLDLGVSSPQLDEPDRGFSFLHDGPLDMRMNNQSGQTAADLLKTVSVGDLARVISRFGEDRFALKIAHAIERARANAPIERTSQLAEIVSAAIPRRFHEVKKHPATRTFQAIRIWVNDELEQLRQGLVAAFDVLRPHGRLAVISFHSLEDRQVKNFMRDLSQDDPHFRGLPSIPVSAQARGRLIDRAQKASDEEIAANPRSRSAVLRIMERLR